ncbi:MAG: hypothetical protein IPG22_22690 [Acidobacteria bacterium]|nr:hypothetical protein [Acidobacteriota bacterium]
MVCRTPAKVSARTDEAWKTSFRKINESDRAELKIFLDTQMGAPKLIEAKAQFNSVGCAGCHTVGSFGGDAGVNLSLSGYKDPNQLNFTKVQGDHTLSNWIVQHFRSPASTVAGSQMPVLGLSENQIDLLTLYTFASTQHACRTFSTERPRQAMRFGEREFAKDGETIYTAVCSSCHGADGPWNPFPGPRYQTRL